MIEEANDFVLPNDPAKREKIKAAVNNAVDAMVRRKAESDFITESLREVGDDVGIKAKYLRRLAKVRFKGNIAEERHESEALSDAHDLLFE